MHDLCDKPLSEIFEIVRRGYLLLSQDLTLWLIGYKLGAEENLKISTESLTYVLIAKLSP